MSSPLPEPSQADDALQGLSVFEQEVIEIFVRGAQLLSLPKSIGEIYGLLYASENPLTLDQIAELLRMSKGSASQGLRFLSSLAAVRKVYVPGDRRDHYEAEVRLRHLGEGLLRERVDPHIQSGQERLERLESLTDNLSPHLQERFKRLKKWHSLARRMMPFVRRVFSK